MAGSGQPRRKAQYGCRLYFDIKDQEVWMILDWQSGDSVKSNDVKASWVNRIN